MVDGGAVEGICNAPLWTFEGWLGTEGNLEPVFYLNIVASLQPDYNCDISCSYSENWPQGNGNQLTLELNVNST